jgi:hypothetical protein
MEGGDSGEDDQSDAVSSSDISKNNKLSKE